MVRPVDMQVNLMKLGEIIQNVKNDQLQSIINDQDRSSEAERIKDVSSRATTKTERSEWGKQVRSREEGARRGSTSGAFNLDIKSEDEGDVTDEKNIGTGAVKTRACRIDILT